jgi:precorrin-6A/cobalt-precorrin-6A reductase
MPTRRGKRQGPCRLLLLGGTGEAAALARAVIARFGPRLSLTTSLAGRTERPVPVPGDVRIGGFGGADGLAAYLRAHAIDLVVDATHPFADQISAHARLACEAVGVPRLMLQRPPWERHPLDRWIEVADLAGAAAVVGKVGRTAWLTIGASEIGAFADVVDVRFLVRLIHMPRTRLPLRFHEVVLGRGPFTVAEEAHLLQRHAVDVLVCKASGGSATEAKLIAAREVSLPVIMVRRPQAEPGEAVGSVEAALVWLGQRLGNGTQAASDRSLP